MRWAWLPPTWDAYKVLKRLSMIPGDPWEVNTQKTLWLGSQIFGQRESRILETHTRCKPEH